MSARSLVCRSIVLLFPFVCSLGQLIPAGQPVPKTTLPPVVFLNGYQTDCSSETFAGSFGIADQVLQANGEVSLFFDNCTVPNKPAIEDLGAAFGSFLTALRYTDGTPVQTVDVVAHSMGGLIVRAYLAGMKNTTGAFAPPTQTGIRKAIFLATPNFGSPISAIFGIDAQTNEMAPGSHFQFALGTWNQQSDDLRGVDAIAVAGNGGTGVLTKTPGFDDGVVPLSSASLGFYLPGRTRVLPYCHVPGDSLPAAVGLCPATAKGIAVFTSTTQDTAQIVTSFFNSTAAWLSIGTPAEQNPLLSTVGGVIAEQQDLNGTPVNTSNGAVTSAAGSQQLSFGNSQVGFTNMVGAGGVNVTMDSATRPYVLKPSVYQAMVVKPGPNIARVTPAAAAISPLSVAPRMIVSIYGDALAAGTAQAASQPLPATLSDVQVTVGGTAAGLLYVSPTQINAVLPASVATGLAQLKIQNSAGSQTVNLWVVAEFAAVFTQNQSGSGAASVLKGDQTVISSANPLRAGDYAEIYATGLGGASVAPTVSIGGVACPVTYAGPAPGYTGLDQINCQAPAGIAPGAANLVVTVGSSVSNTTTVAVQ